MRKLAVTAVAATFALGGFAVTGSTEATTAVVIVTPITAAAMVVTVGGEA